VRNLWSRLKGDHFGFLTCPPNAEVGAIHRKAIPVILAEPAEGKARRTTPSGKALGCRGCSLRVLSLLIAHEARWPLYSRAHAKVD
jgi:hypothetical protein